MMYLPIPSISTRLSLSPLSLHFFLRLVARCEAEIVSMEQRKKKRSKAREEGTASPSDDVIVVGCSSAGKQPRKGTGTAPTSSNSEDDNAGVIRVDPVQRSDLQSCSSAQATCGEILFVEEVQTQTDKNDAPTGTTPQASGAAQDEARPREEGQQAHGRGKKKLPYSHESRLHGHNEVKGRSVLPELPDSSFLPPASTNQSSSLSEYISSLDILHSLPVVGIDLPQGGSPSVKWHSTVPD